MKWYIARRLAWTVVASFILLSAAFFAIALTPDPNRFLASMGAAFEARQTGADPKVAAQQAIAAYDEARNRDRPLLIRYWDWVSGYATLRWGWSYHYGKPVGAVMARAVPVTLSYTIPGVAVAWVASVLGAAYVTVRGGLPDTVARALTYIGLGVPAVIIAKTLSSYHRIEAIDLPQYDAALGFVAPQNLSAIAIPAALVAFSILMSQWRAVRAEALDLVEAEFVKTLRAQGADTRRLARHVLKNATAPLLAMSTAEALMILFLTMYVVEVLLGVPGLGAVTIRAFEERDIGLILASVLLPAFVGLLGNLLTDIVTVVVDPRVSEPDT